MVRTGVKPRVGQVLVVAVAGLVLAGCGNDDGGGGGQTEPRGQAPPQASEQALEPLAERVNGICDRFRKDLGAIPPPQDQVESRRYSVRAAEVGDAFVERLREQDPPADVRDEYRRYVDAHEEALDLVDKLRRARDRRDERSASRFERAVAPATERVDALAGELGFTRCASSGG